MPDDRASRSCLVAAVALTLCMGGGRALTAQATGTIEGTVIDAGSRRPLAGAQVTIVGSPLRALTTASGSFRLTQVGAGARQVRARVLGFTALTRTVTVVEAQTVRTDFELAQSAIELEAVVTTGSP